MSRVFASVRPRSFGQRDALGRFRPKHFQSEQTKGRFERDRIDLYLSAIDGEPNGEQSALIAVAVSSEWDWLRLADEATEASGAEKVEKERRASECRRQFLLAIKHFYPTLRVTAAVKLETPAPEPRLDQKLEVLRRKRSIPA